VRKFESKAERCVFLGYSEKSKGYRLWNLDHRKVIVRRDVYFNETCFPFTESLLPVSESSKPAPTSTLQFPWPRSDVSACSESELKKPDMPVSSSSESPEPKLTEVDMTQTNPPSLLREPLRRSGRSNRGVPAQNFVPSMTADSKWSEPGKSEQSDFATPWWNPIGSIKALLATSLGVADRTPRTYREAISGPDAHHWKLAIEEELKSHQQHGTWTCVARPAGRRLVGSTWVFKIKRGENGEIIRYKARLCAQGFSQIPGVDFTETFAPVVSFRSVRTLLAIAAAEDLDLDQMDVKTAFLYGKLDDEVYMSQPDGVRGDHAGQVLRLNKSIFGLRQSPRVWNSQLNSYLVSLGFKRCVTDPCLYIRRREGRVLIVAVFVDDIVIASNHVATKQWLKNRLSAKYQMTDCGELRWFLGTRVLRDRANNTITLDQSQYIDDVLRRFGMSNCHSVSTPAVTRLTSDMCPSTESDVRFMNDKPYRQVVGCLMYAMVATRPDIAYAVGSVCRFLHNPGPQHWNAVLHILRYLRGHSNLGLSFSGKPSDLRQLHGYCDADWAGDQDTRRSTTGYIFRLCGAAISWKSRLQKTPALSSTEAEYMSAGAGVQEAISLRALLLELGYSQPSATVIHEDNRGCISLASQVATNHRSRHIDIRHHFLRHYVHNKTVELKYQRTKFMVADILTKPVPKALFQNLRSGLLGNQRSGSVVS
jgi:hypothetical protein